MAMENSICLISEEPYISPLSIQTKIEVLCCLTQTPMTILSASASSNSNVWI